MDAVRVRGSGLVGAVAPGVLVWWWRGWDGESEMDWIGSVRSVHHLWLRCKCEQRTSLLASGLKLMELHNTAVLFQPTAKTE